MARHTRSSPAHIHGSPSLDTRRRRNLEGHLGPDRHRRQRNDELVHYRAMHRFQLQRPGQLQDRPDTECEQADPRGRVRPPVLTDQISPGVRRTFYNARSNRRPHAYDKNWVEMLQPVSF